MSSSVIYSFHWKGLWYPSLNLTFETNINGIVSLISSKSVHYWYTERILISIYWFYSLLLWKKCLWFLRAFWLSF
jgi:hypothetical protein